MPLSKDLHAIAADWQANPLEAFVLLGEGLRHASRTLGRDDPDRLDQHLSAEELVQGMVEILVDRCGLMAWSIFQRWGLFAGDDIGALTFYLIDRGILGKQDEDRREDFANLPPLKGLVQAYFDRQLEASLAALN